VRQCKSVTVTSRRVIFVFGASFSAVCSLNVLTRQRLTFFKGLFVYNIHHGVSSSRYIELVCDDRLLCAYFNATFF